MRYIAILCLTFACVLSMGLSAASLPTVARLCGRVLLAGSAGNALGSAGRVVPQAYSDAQENPARACEMLYGSALVGALTGFQTIATFPLSLAQYIGAATGLTKRRYPMAKVAYAIEPSSPKEPRTWMIENK